MLNQRRQNAIDAVLRAVRTGEFSAAHDAASKLAPDIVLSSGGTDVVGIDAVTDRLNGQWPLTSVYAQGEWTEPVSVAGTARVGATFPTFGTIKGYELKFTFDEGDRVTRLDETITMYPAPKPLEHIPPVAKTAINGALANGTPIVVGYPDANGVPVLSIRGSTQVYSDLELCIWVRNAKSGIIDAVRAGRPLSLLYRNSPRRMTLVMSGRGSIAEDPAARDRVWALSPEVEKRHDPARNGVALLIRIERMAGNAPGGPVLVVAPK